MASCLRALGRRSFATHAAKGDRVVVGMSGGVDSSVAARLLAHQDVDLSAVFMRNWDTRDESGTDKGCEWEKDWEDVQRVCSMLDIPCSMIDLSRQYWNRVFEPSLNQWGLGVTPNPDVWCNKEIKFGALLEHLRIDPHTTKSPWFATGHYARKSWTSPMHSSASPRPKLLRAADRKKDQSFYLSSISEQGLRRALFPLGDLTKPQVRELAKKYNLPTADRTESMGLCFVGEKSKFSDFLSSYIPPRPGPIVDLTTGETVGKHRGLWTYTIGENARLGGMPMKMFVAQKDTSANIVYVVPGSNHEALYCSTLHVADFAWIWKEAPPIDIRTSNRFRASVQYRHRMEDVPCTVHMAQTANPKREMTIHFDSPQKSVAPGQVAALWDGDWCLGCGVITRASSLPLPDPVAEQTGARLQGMDETGQAVKDWQWWA